MAAGTNTAPTIVVGPQSKAIVEAGTTVAGQSTATIRISVSDADVGDAATFDPVGWNDSVQISSPFFKKVALPESTPSMWGVGDYGLEPIFMKKGVYGNAFYYSVSNKVEYFLQNSYEKTDLLQATDLVTEIFSVSFKDKSGAVTTTTIGFAISGSDDGVTVGGSQGNDTIWPFAVVPGVLSTTKHDDIVFGNGGDDRIWGGRGKDVIDGGAGIDMAGYSDKTQSVVVTLNGASDATVFVGGVAEDTVRNIENVMGGTGNDRFVGDALANVFFGLAGKDVIDGGAGSDTADYSEKTQSVSVALKGVSDASVFVAGMAEDTVRNIENIVGGSADDTITGDSFDNRITGRAGKDRLDGGGGIDAASYSDKTVSVAVTLKGSTEVTVLVGGVAEDTIANFENLSGGSAADTLTGDGLANSIWGNAGDDLLSGSGGNDRLYGSLGKDMLFGGNDADALFGEEDDDRIWGGSGKDVIDGGAGMDTAGYSDKTQSVVVTLNGASDATVFVGGVAEDTVRNIENVMGGTGNDRLVGDALANVFFGLAGKDVIDGGAGSDTADYSEKTQSVSVVLKGASDASVFVAGMAEDTVRNIENIVGGSADDTITGDSFDNRITGRAGKDRLDGGGGIDAASYSDKTVSVAVTLKGSTEVTVLVGGVAEDTIANFENLSGGSAADTLTGDGLANSIWGNAGDDLLSGSGGNDRLYGSLGKDTLHGGNDADTLFGEEGDDVLYGDEGADFLYGGDGADSLYASLSGEDALFGGAGDDLFYVSGGTDKFDSIRGEAGYDRIILDGPMGLSVLSAKSFTGIESIESVDTNPSMETLFSPNTEFYGTDGADVYDWRGYEGTVSARTELGEGDDKFYGSNTRDGNDYTVFGGEGNDTLVGGGAHSHLYGEDGNDTIYAQGLMSFVYGGDGDDSIYGLSGVQYDRVPHYSILNGDAGNDAIYGTASRERSNGGEGDDYISGGGGFDSLNGGAGNDVLEGKVMNVPAFTSFREEFVFDTALDAATNVDTIFGFDPGKGETWHSDAISLAQTIFTALGAGDLQASDFVIGPVATTAAQHIIYDTATGGLFYDADGSGSAAQVQFAKLETGLALTAQNFVVS